MGTDTPLARIIRRRSLRSWQKLAKNAPRLRGSTLQKTAQQAKDLRAYLDAILAQTANDTPSHLPLRRAEWRWAPEAARLSLAPPEQVGVKNDSRFGQGLKVFHDGAPPEICLRQRPAKTGPGFEIALETHQFGGTFLSMVFDLPLAGRIDLGRGHVVSLLARIDLERPVVLHARLNLQTGPNTWTEARRVAPDDQGVLVAEFDLSHMGLGERAVDGAWVDLIFDAPDMNAIVLSDLIIARRPAAQF